MCEALVSDARLCRVTRLDNREGRGYEGRVRVFIVLCKDPLEEAELL